MLYRTIPEDTFKLHFVVLEGDYSRFNKVFINAYSESKEYAKLQKELAEFLYDDEGNLLITFPDTEPGKDWDFFVDCGFIL